MRLLRKARGALTVAGRKAGAAHKSQKPDKRVSAACEGQIRGAREAVKADAS